MQNLIVLDVETGGREEEENPITQLALQVITPEDFEVLHSFDTVVKPYNNLVVSKEAIDYTRVSVKEINEKGVDVNVLMKGLIEAFKIANKTGKANNRPIIVGHNIPFDIKFLKYLFDYKNKNIYDYLDDSHFDTLKMMKLLEAGSLKSSEISRYTLSACCERFGINLKTAHGAVGDVEATKHLFIGITNILRKNNKDGNKSGNKISESPTKQKKSRESYYFEI